mgnify:CR=1 FL=1
MNEETQVAEPTETSTTPSETTFDWKNEIPEEVKDKIFDKFYTTKDKKGSGLGLGIVQNVASSHQAKITLNSSEKETCFQFSFKLKDAN